MTTVVLSGIREFRNTQPLVLRFRAILAKAASDVELVIG
jgi:hypothetical protein